MAILSHKPTWIKQGAELAVAFNMPIDTRTYDATAVIVTFYCYRDTFHSKRLHVHVIFATRAILIKQLCQSYSLFWKS